MDLTIIRPLMKDIIKNDKIRYTFSDIEKTKLKGCISHLIFELLTEENDDYYIINKKDDYESTKNFIIKKLIEVYKKMITNEHAFYTNKSIHPKTKKIIAYNYELSPEKIPYDCVIDENNRAYAFYEVLHDLLFNNSY